ncbi:MAG TPA: glutamine-hydrolyzing carbamoyl-phosphate synthase small subunit [Candidatus Limnocylindria bacterium]|nr:glutamine-hydrolyzing carbamoyl-phosphate synthase small subunit [Candidatus Limnocylindria bacterium]
MTTSRPAILALADGTVFRGRAFGAVGEAAGELVFNTSMTGYQEILTDPSYEGQLVAMTYPQIGNVGVNRYDVEARRPFVRGFVVREYRHVPSSWRAEQPLGDYLAAHGIPGIEGIDTRALVRHLRDHGAQEAVLSTADLDAERLVRKAKDTPSLVGRDLVREVTCREPYDWTEGPWRPGGAQTLEQIVAATGKRPLRVVAYDFGIKQNILRNLVEVGCAVHVVPADTPARSVLAMRPDGVFLSNGPGDPDAVAGARENVADLLGNVPVFGICLGHQILGLALGGRTYKLKFGHHGGNQPVKDLLTDKVEITAQNHGFAVDPESLAGRAKVTHINLNDRTVEGLEVEGQPTFSVQYHPEASPGPHDAAYLFRRFVDRMERP